MAPMTMAERILARACGREEVSPGDIVEARADLLYMHEMLALALGPFNEIGITKVWDPTNMVGACGAFAVGVGATDTAAVMAKGSLWLRVPETMKVYIDGRLGTHVYAKDAILKIIATTGDDGARYQSVEFTGPTAAALPMHERLALCNMTTEMGAKAGVVE